jgi:Pyruvate/2-oxoacid:ferredoxin oxidoreductase delta subunit/flavodoxin
MKALCIRYYSATGNTKRAVEKLAEQARESGFEVGIAALSGEAGTVELGDPESELVIGFSLYGLGSVHSFRRRLARAPLGSGRRAHIIAVCGAELYKGKRVPGWPGQAVEQVEHILKRRGYEVVSSAFVSYPNNWMQLFAPAMGEDVERLLAAGDAEVKAYASAFLFGSAKLYRCGFGNLLWTVPVSRMFDVVARRFLGKIYASGPECDNCALCARSCPAGAIRMSRGGPIWKASCDGCNRCINVCPKRTIQASTFKLGLDLVASVALIWACFPLTRLALGGLGIACLGFWEALIALALATTLTPPTLALLFGPVDALLHLASRIPSFRSFLALGPSRHHGRYLAPGFVPGKDH